MLGSNPIIKLLSDLITQVGCARAPGGLCREFVAILGRGPRAFKIGKISAVNP